MGALSRQRFVFQFLAECGLKKAVVPQIIPTVGKGREREGWGYRDSLFLCQVTCPGSLLISTQPTFTELLLGAKCGAGVRVIYSLAGRLSEVGNYRWDAC